MNSLYLKAKVYAVFIFLMAAPFGVQASELTDYVKANDPRVSKSFCEGVDKLNNCLMRAETAVNFCQLNAGGLPGREEVLEWALSNGASRLESKFAGFNMTNTRPPELLNEIAEMGKNGYSAILTIERQPKLRFYYGRGQFHRPEAGTIFCSEDINRYGSQYCLNGSTGEYVVQSKWDASAVRCKI